MVWKAALILAAAASSAGPTKFDLECTHKNGNPGVSLRIDLDAGEWCHKRLGCRSVEKIVSATSGKIVLSEHERAHAFDYFERQEVNRVTGEYTSIYEGSISNASVQDCVAAPYSGETAPRAKF